MEEIKDIIAGMFSNERAQPEGNDYYDDEDGLLHCGKCKGAKETRVNIPDFQNPDGPGRVAVLPCICKCRQEEMQRKKEAEMHEEQMRRIESLRAGSLIESKYRNANFRNFQRTKANDRAFRIAVRYTERFDEMFCKNQGLIFWGKVGTGKSYTAACIANELLAKLTTVIMTSFVKILQDVQNPQFDEASYISKLNSAKLLIIDDLGTERGTEYANEKVYNVIDSRYRSSKPMILTTNMTIEEMMQTTDIRYKRIYDRIFEMCYPVKMAGASWRQQEAAKRFDEMKNLMEEE